MSQIPTSFPATYDRRKLIRTSLTTAAAAGLFAPRVSAFTASAVLSAGPPTRIEAGSGAGVNFCQHQILSVDPAFATLPGICDACGDIGVNSIICVDCPGDCTKHQAPNPQCFEVLNSSGQVICRGTWDGANGSGTVRDCAPCPCVVSDQPRCTYPPPGGVQCFSRWKYADC